MVQIITDENFEKEVLNSEKPVLIDFWGIGCVPCKTMQPIIEEISDEYKKTIKVGKVDVYANPITSSKYGIHSLPSFLLFKDGKPWDMIIGTQSKNEIKDRVDSIL